MDFADGSAPSYESVNIDEAKQGKFIGASFDVESASEKDSTAANKGCLDAAKHPQR